MSVNLFLFAHQDDEFGVYAELEKLIAHQERVIVVYLTSGSLSGKNSAIRNSESVSVLCKLGILKSDIYFLGSQFCISDGKLSQSIDLMSDHIGNFCKDLNVSRLYFLAYEGGHQDHDAVHLIGVKLATKLNILDCSFQFSLYHGKNLPFGLFTVLSPISENGIVISYRIPFLNRIKYLRLCFEFKSQKIPWLGLLPFFITHYLFYGTQDLQKVRVERVFDKPHIGRVLYEKRKFYIYTDFVNDAKKLLDSLN